MTLQNEKMDIDYNNRKFKAISNSESSEVTDEVIFHYKQNGVILSCSYSGGDISQGHLLGLVGINGKISMRYHQINKNGQIRSGKCTSFPEQDENGKLRLNEEWMWHDGNECGSSILVEI